jgi:predicted nucleic acid-binding protein
VPGLEMKQRKAVRLMWAHTGEAIAIAGEASIPETRPPEVGEVLARSKIKKKYLIPPADRDSFHHLLRQDALVLPHAPGLGLCRHSDENYILACAEAGAADYTILSAREFPTIVSG